MLDCSPISRSQALRLAAPYSPSEDRFPVHHPTQRAAIGQPLAISRPHQVLRNPTHREEFTVLATLDIQQRHAGHPEHIVHSRGSAHRQSQSCTVRCPGVCPDLHALWRDDTRRARPHIEQPQPPILPVGIPHARIVAPLAALLLFLGLRFDHEEREKPPVRRPTEVIDLTRLIENAKRLASVPRYQIDTGFPTFGPVGQERDPPAVRRPARFPIVPESTRELASLSLHERHDPQATPPVLLFPTDRANHIDDRLSVRSHLDIEGALHRDQFIDREDSRFVLVHIHLLAVENHEGYVVRSASDPSPSARLVVLPRVDVPRH